MRELGIRDVQSIARLAHLRLAPGSLEGWRRQLARILAAFSALEAVDVSGVAPTTHVQDPGNGTRADEPRPCLPRASVLAPAADSAQGHFRVPRVIG
ncbi:MAG: Asp-tRNA(Asn)/Glu-tRNA(Gln) amidotransferase subunit GatC [Acidobacteriota bacterium]